MIQGRRQSIRSADPRRAVQGPLRREETERSKAERFRIEGLTKTHRHRRVLCGIDLAVGEGEIVGLVGNNGAGKSTLISIASGAARANGGTMHLSVRPYRPSSEREALELGVRRRAAALRGACGHERPRVHRCR